MARTTPVDDRRITTFGRLVEAHARVEQQLGQALEGECGIPHTWSRSCCVSAARKRFHHHGFIGAPGRADERRITGLVDRMVAAGLVQRLPSPADRRMHFAELTGKGRQTLERAAALHSDSLRVVFADFSRSDLAMLDDLLDRLRRVDRHLV